MYDIGRVRSVPHEASGFRTSEPSRCSTGSQQSTRYKEEIIHMYDNSSTIRGGVTNDTQLGMVQKRRRPRLAFVNLPSSAPLMMRLNLLGKQRLSNVYVDSSSALHN